MKGLLIAILLIPGAIQAQEMLDIELDQSGWLKKIKEKTNVSISAETGSSSNVTKTTDGESGSFTKFKPALSLEFEPTDNIVVAPMLSTEFTRFTDASNARLADEDYVEFRTMALHFTDGGDEWSTEAAHVRSKTRIPIISSDLTTIPLLQKYEENEIRTGWAGYGEANEGSLMLIYRDQNHDLPLQDRGNEFLNDHETMAAELKVGHSVSESLKVYLKANYQRKDYQFRPADFSDGAASSPDSTHPLLRQDVQEYTLESALEMGRHKMGIALGYQLLKDRIFGAGDNRGIKPKVDLTTAWSERFETKIGAAATQSAYSNFRVDPSLGSQSELRNEWQFTSSFTMRWEFTRVLSLIGGWDYSRLSTNFAAGSYTDHTLSTGIQWKL